MVEEPLSSAALAYAQDLGWPVFPVRPGHKSPLPGTHGFQDASRDAGQIRAWWARWPQANIGLACGAAGLVVVDLDCKHGDDGLAAWAELLSRRGLQVETVTSATPSGGRHLFFAAPPGASMRSSAKRLGPGIDTRAAGGYVLLPPSVIRGGEHPGAYTWQPAAGPGQRPFAPFPAELAALLAASSP
jgi:hypothetical protein